MGGDAIVVRILSCGCAAGEDNWSLIRSLCFCSTLLLADSAEARARDRLHESEKKDSGIGDGTLESGHSMFLASFFRLLTFFLLLPSLSTCFFPRSSFVLCLPISARAFISRAFSPVVALLAHGRALKNQFNFSERASQTFNNPMRDREVVSVGDSAVRRRVFIHVGPLYMGVA